MINASGGSTPNQTTENKPSTPPTVPTSGPGFPTHNPAMQHQNLMPKTPAQSPITNTTNSVVNNTGATPPAAPKFPDPTKNLVRATDSIETANSNNGSDSTKPKSKLNLKMILGVVVLLLVVLGSGAGFYLSQQTQDLRQQASENVQGDDPGNMTFGLKGPGIDGNRNPNIPGVCDWNEEVDDDVINGELRQTSPTVQTTAGFRYLGNNKTLFCSTIYNVSNEALTMSDTNSFHCPEKPPNIACNILGSNVGCSTDRDDDAVGGGLENPNLTLQPGDSYTRCDEYITPGGACGLAQGDWRFPGHTNVNGGGPFGIVYNMGDRCEEEELVVQCNDVCTSDTQCQSSNTQCLSAYDFSSSWSDVTNNVSDVGSGTITAFEAFVRNDIVEQYLVRDNKIWYRPNFTTSWADVTSNVANIGSGDITSFNVYVTTSGAVEQWLVRGGKIWHRPNLTSQFQDITTNVAGIGSGTITSYNVEKYSDDHQNIVSAYLIRGGEVFHHTSSDWTLWQDVTSNLSSVGSGNITDHGFLLKTNNELVQYSTRDGKIWSITAPLENDKRCRLPAYPNSGSCQPPTPITPTTPSCRTSCDPTAAVDVCTNADSTLNCDPTTSECRFTDNLPDINCKDVVVIPSCRTQCDPTATVDVCTNADSTLSCDPTTSECRFTDNLPDIDCKDVVKLTCDDTCVVPAAGEIDTCITDINEDHSCIEGVCRLTANSTSDLCIAPTCGDGTIQSPETCDDGTDNNSDTVANACRTDCTLPTCGDGVIDNNETCDDGNDIDTDDCTNICTLPTCGDGVTQVPEVCDDGNDDQTDDCRNCKLPTCGDGTVDTGESCDDGNTDNNDSCRNNCEEPSCGDGTVDTGESCDDGNTTSGDGCSSSCTEEVAVGCNNSCVTSADCDDTNHSCVTVEDGSSKCRLDSYPTSTTCTLPAAETTQPTLPPELPQTGPEDWMNWFKAGLVTTFLGGVLFFLL